ncbi:PLD nuclease N-terminal domain-containing protein [Streptomyces pratensis]|uniref:PLD nuclease N-terminal domain-containing protein n=1 Tax=Streptomyces pratensis TaxID=1169025 RepID=UPI0030198E42
MRALMILVPMALMIYAFIDCLNTPEEETKHLPKLAWVFIILLFWVVGAIGWIVAGKKRRGASGGGMAASWQRGRRTQWVAPDDNPDFLKSLKSDVRGADGEETVAAPEKRDPAGAAADSGAEKDGQAPSPTDREADPLREEEPKRRERSTGPDDATPPVTG